MIFFRVSPELEYFRTKKSAIGGSGKYWKE